MVLTQYLGDTAVHVIPMTWGGLSFTPDENWEGLFSAKFRSTDDDDAAAFQKSTAAGMTFDGDMALVTTVGIDTDTLTVDGLTCDVRLRHLTTGERRTVAVVFLKLLVPRTRGVAASLPIYTTDPPTRETIVLNRLTGIYERLYLDETAGDGSVTLKSEPYGTTPPLESPTILNRLTGLRELLFLDETSGDGVAVLKSEPV